MSETPYADRYPEIAKMAKLLFKLCEENDLGDPLEYYKACKSLDEAIEHARAGVKGHA